MKYDLEQLKALVEGGDTASIDAYLYKAIEKEDVALVQKVNADVRSAIDSEKDTHHAKALDTWKANNLETLVDEEVKKRNPEKTPAEIEVEKLRKEIEDERNARNRETLKNTALKQLTDEGLPTNLIDRLLADDEESTTANISAFKEVIELAKQSAIDGIYKGNGGKPEQSATGGSQTANLSELAAAANLRNQ